MVCQSIMKYKYSSSSMPAGIRLLWTLSFQLIPTFQNIAYRYKKEGVSNSIKLSRLDLSGLSLVLNMLLQLQFLLLNGDGGFDVGSTLGLVDGTEENIHVLEGLLLGLLDHEDGKGAVCEAENAEHDEGAPADVADGMGCELGDDEVEEPLGCRCRGDSELGVRSAYGDQRLTSQAHAISSQTCWEDLRDIHPWSWTPGGRVTDDVEIDHADHRDGRMGDSATGRVRRMRVEDTTNDEHHRSHPNSTGNECRTTAPEINADDQEDTRGRDFDGSVDTSGEERAVGLGNTDGLKDFRSVVANAVCTGELLANHDHESDEEPLAIALLDSLLPGNALGLVEFFFDRCADLSELFHDLWVVDGGTAEVGERLSSFLVSSLLHEPTGRLLEEEQTDEHDATWDELDTDWNSPLLCAFWDVQRDAVVQPVSESAANDKQFLEETSNTATNSGRRALRDEDGRDTAHTTNTETGNDTTGIDLADGMASTSLNGGTDKEDDREDHERVATADTLIGENGSNGTKEAARGEQRDNVCRDVCVFGACETG